MALSSHSDSYFIRVCPFCKRDSLARWCVGGWDDPHPIEVMERIEVVPLHQREGAEDRSARDWVSDCQAAEAARDYWQGRAQALEAELNARPSTDRGAVELEDADAS